MRLLEDYGHGTLLRCLSLQMNRDRIRRNGVIGYPWKHLESMIEILWDVVKNEMYEKDQTMIQRVLNKDRFKNSDYS